MKVDFDLISPEDFEFLCEDLLRAKSFTIETRPSRGPDRGKDMIAVRDVTDDMGLTYREKWVIECKHFSRSNRSVTETDIGNFEARMKVHKANRYLLITSTTVSETVKDQLKALSEDQSNSRMATFWAKNDLIRFLGQYSDIYNRHFSSWEKQAVEAANLLQKHHFSAHRGAILWCPNTTAVFGNDGHSLQESEAMNEEKKAAVLRSRREVENFRELIQGKGIEEIAFGTSSNGYTWVILVRSNAVNELNDLIWTCYPSGGSNNRFQREEAFKSIWMFLNSPLKETS